MGEKEERDREEQRERERKRHIGQGVLSLPQQSGSLTKDS